MLPDNEEKQELIEMIDTAYNMGKRMATKLDEYRFGVPREDSFGEGLAND